MFTRVFQRIEEVFTQIVDPMDASNASLVHMLEVDSNKLCETAEGLVGGKLVLEHVRQVVASLVENSKHQDVPPVPEMTVVDDRDEPTESEPEHQEEDAPAPSPSP